MSDNDMQPALPIRAATMLSLATAAPVQCDSVGRGGGEGVLRGWGVGSASIAFQARVPPDYTVSKTEHKQGHIRFREG